MTFDAGDGLNDLLRVIDCFREDCSSLFLYICLIK